MIRALLVDLDGTLYPWTPEAVAEWCEAFYGFAERAFGMPRAEAVVLNDRLYHGYGATLRGLLEEGYPVDVEAYLRLWEDVDVRRGISADPALDDALARVGVPMSVCTNTPAAHAERVLSHLGVRGRFHSVIDVRAMGMRTKPDLEAYRAAAATLGLQPEECALVDDAPGFFPNARALGIRTIYFGAKPDVAADERIATIRELPDAVARLLAR